MRNDLLTDRVFLGDEFFKFCQKEYEEARRFLKKMRASQRRVRRVVDSVQQGHRARFLALALTTLLLFQTELYYL